MNDTTAINLISTAAQLSPALLALSEKLKRVSQVSLPVFFVVSILAASSYAILRTQVRSLASQTARIRSQIADQAEKQALILMVRERGKIVGKVLSGRSRWAPAFTQINSIAPTGTLASFSVDEKRRVVLTMQMSTLNDVFPALSALLKEMEEKRILTPEIVSFQIDSDGISRLVVSYIPVL